MPKTIHAQILKQEESNITRKEKIDLSFFKKFSAPKAKVELKLEEAAYNYTDKLTGRIILDPQEEISVNEIRLEFGGSRKVRWKKGFSSLNTTSSLETKKIPIGGPVKLQKEQRYEQPFQVNIPLYSRPDLFTETELTVKGIIAVQGRPDITHEIKLGITFPYVIECLRQYGGCGFITQPLPTPILTCPACGKNLEEMWNQKYSDEAKS